MNYESYGSSRWNYCVMGVMLLDVLATALFIFDLLDKVDFLWFSQMYDRPTDRLTDGPTCLVNLLSHWWYNRECWFFLVLDASVTDRLTRQTDTQTFGLKDPLIAMHGRINNEPVFPVFHMIKIIGTRKLNRKRFKTKLLKSRLLRNDFWKN